MLLSLKTVKENFMLLSIYLVFRLFNKNIYTFTHHYKRVESLIVGLS